MKIPQLLKLLKFFNPQCPHIDSPDWPIFLPNSLQARFGLKIKAFSLCFFFLTNSHNSLSWWCMYVGRRKLMLITLRKVNRKVAFPVHTTEFSKRTAVSPKT